MADYQFPAREALCYSMLPLAAERPVPRLLDACCPAISSLAAASAAARGYALTACDIAPRESRVVAADLVKLPFASGHFRGVISSDTLEHVAGWRQALSEIRRVLEPGGFFILHLPVGTASKGVKNPETMPIAKPVKKDHFHVMHPGMDMRGHVEAVGFDCVAEMAIFDSSRMRGGALWVFLRKP